MLVNNEISGYNVTLMSNGFGWIELTHGGHAAGFIYLSDEKDGSDRIGNKAGREGAPPYVVMHHPYTFMTGLLHILDNQTNLRIELNEETGSEALLLSSGARQISADSEDPRPRSQTLA